MSDATVMRRFRGYLCHCTSMVAVDDSTPALCPTHGAGGVLPEEVTPAGSGMPLGLVHHAATPVRGSGV